MLRGPRAAATAAAAAVFVLGGGNARAQVGTSLNRPGTGARAAGMANAFVAVSDDGTAASWNPAGLSQLRKPEFSLVQTMGARRLTLDGMRSADGTIAYSNRDATSASSAPEFASAAVPFTLARTVVTVQVGWQRIYNLGGDFSADVASTSLAQPGPDTRVFVGGQAGGSINRGFLSAAVKLGGHVAIGSSFNLWRGGWDERSTFEGPSVAGAASDFLEIRSDYRVRGTNVTAGLLLTYPRVNVGFVYSSPFWSRFDFHREQRSNLQAPLSYDAGTRARFRLPRLLAGGVAWRPAPRWTLAADLTHDQWTDTLLKGLPGESEPTNFFDGLPPRFSSTRDTVSISVGAEHLFLREGSVLPLRLGFAWEPQGAMDFVTRDPLSYYMVAAGGGYNTNSLKFDAALQYRWGSFHGSDAVRVRTVLMGATERDAFGRVGSSEWRLKLSAIYRIPETEKLRGLVRKIFG